MKIKFIIPLFMLLFVIISCCIYTSNRERYYTQNPEYIDDNIFNIGYLIDGDDGTRGFVEFCDNNVTICLNIPSWENKSVYISKFEQYILIDYLKNVLDIYNKIDDTTNINSRGSLSIDLHNSYDNKSALIKREPKGDFNLNMFFIMVTTMVYIRTAYPYIILVYFLVFLFLFITAKKYLKTCNKNFAQLKSAVNMPLKFLIFSVIMLIAFEFVIGFKPIHWALTEINIRDFIIEHELYHRKRWEIREPADLYVNVMNIYGNIIETINFIKIRDVTQAKGTNFAALMPILIAEIIMLWKMSKKDKRLCISYLVPSVVLAAMHRYFFMGTSIYSLNGKYRKLLYFNEIFPLHPKIFYFTLFFVIGLVLYGVFGLIINKNKYKSICWSFVFAVSNAGLVCMSTYVAQYAVRLL